LTSLLLLISAAATLLDHDITTIDPHQASMAAPASTELKKKRKMRSRP
jgi:hypothetical protein